MRIAGLLLMLVATIATAAPWSENPDEALAEAARRGQPLLVDFYAPWCYSCYFMDQQVLETGPFEARAGRLALLKLDVDTAPGAAEQDRRNIAVLPTYLLLDPRGTEIDRLVGEQSPADFFAWLDRHLDGPARPPEARGSREVIDALMADVRRGSHAAGLRWFAGLEPGLREDVRSSAAGAAALTRLQLLAAAQAGDSGACLQHGLNALSATPACQQAAVVYAGRSCLAAGTAGEQARWNQAVAAAMRGVVETRQLADGQTACADERSPVLLASTALRALNRSGDAQALLDKVIARTREAIGVDLGANRNLADNLRVYLAEAGRETELLALYPQLIAAWPQDYVYAYRYARALGERGRHAEALPFYAQAAAQAYGVNRLRIASRRADSLVALGRREEARAVLKAALKANGRWFAEQADQLRATLRTL